MPTARKTIFHSLHYEDNRGRAPMLLASMALFAVFCFTTINLSPLGSWRFGDSLVIPSALATLASGVLFVTYFFESRVVDRQRFTRVALAIYAIAGAAWGFHYLSSNPVYAASAVYTTSEVRVDDRIYFTDTKRMVQAVSVVTKVVKAGDTLLVTYSTVGHADSTIPLVFLLAVLESKGDVVGCLVRPNITGSRCLMIELTTAKPVRS